MNTEARFKHSLIIGLTLISMVQTVLAFGLMIFYREDSPFQAIYKVTGLWVTVGAMITAFAAYMVICYKPRRHHTPR